MEFFAIRAMDIIRLTHFRLEDLHRRERDRDYLFPTWNIQQLYRLPSLKDQYGIPSDRNTLSNHFKQVEIYLKEKGMFQNDSGQEFYFRNVDSVHDFDWKIWFKRMEMDFSHKDQTKKSNPLKKKVRNLLQVVDGDQILFKEKDQKTM